jgi:adenosylhomocysteinase
LREVERGYFRHLCGALPGRKDVSVICIAHLVDNARFFLPSIDELFTLGLVLPKPKSADPSIAAEIARQFRTFPLTRAWAADPKQVVRELRRVKEIKHGGKVIFVDIGAYFAESLPGICKLLRGQVLGVLEGTENGLQKYERRPDQIPVPLFTVARSPLKYPENYLIGTSVVFSIEAVLRDQAEVLQSRQACVIGFGKVGRSVATALRDRGVSTVIHDSSSIALAEAAARGFQIFRGLEEALSHATLVVGATGNTSLNASGFAVLRDKTYVATVTSGDDELDLPSLKIGFARRRLSERVEQFIGEGRSFFLINNGDAVNFAHGAVVGPAIQLVEGEKLACLACLAREDSKNGINELGPAARKEIADIWLDHFAPE